MRPEAQRSLQQNYGSLRCSKGLNAARVAWINCAATLCYRHFAATTALGRFSPFQDVRFSAVRQRQPVHKCAIAPKPTPVLQCPNAVNGLPASRPNLFRPGSRTGPRWASAHSPSPPRDPPPQFTTLPSGRCTVRNNPLETVAYVRFRASTPFHCTRAAAVCTPNALSRNDRPARREVEAALAPVTGIGNRLCRPACSHRPTCRFAASNRPILFRSAVS